MYAAYSLLTSDSYHRRGKSVEEETLPHLAARNRKTKPWPASSQAWSGSPRKVPLAEVLQYDASPAMSEYNANIPIFAI